MKDYPFPQSPFPTTVEGKLMTYSVQELRNTLEGVGDTEKWLYHVPSVRQIREALETKVNDEV